MSAEWVLPNHQRTDSRNTRNSQDCVQKFLISVFFAQAHTYVHIKTYTDTHIHAHTQTGYSTHQSGKHPFHSHNNIKEIRIHLPKIYLFDIELFWTEDNQEEANTRKALCILFASEQNINLQKCLSSSLCQEGRNFITWDNFRPLLAYRGHQRNLHSTHYKLDFICN